MPCHDFVFLTEDASHDAAINHINEEAFGPGRFVRSSERVREQGRMTGGCLLSAATAARSSPRCG